MTQEKKYICERCNVDLGLRSLHHPQSVSRLIKMLFGLFRGHFENLK